MVFDLVISKCIFHVKNYEFKSCDLVFVGGTLKVLEEKVPSRILIFSLKTFDACHVQRMNLRVMAHQEKRVPIQSIISSMHE